MIDPGLKILIVDDMTFMRKTLIKMCKAIGLTNFTEAANGNLAWACVSEANPPFDLIISDWNMPEATGLDLLRKLRADPKLGKTKFLMVTAEGEDKQVAEFVAAGVSGYILKPFVEAALHEKLEEIVGKK